MTEKLYYKYWGKATLDDEQGNSHHLLPYHCLDVAAVADVWWQQSRDISRCFMEIAGLNAKQTRAWLLFLSLCTTTANSTCVFSVKPWRHGKRSTPS